MHGLQARLERKEQSILFLNRRGYSSAMQCRKCGHAEECTHCSITLTYHRADETLRCHLCGLEKPAPARCPECGSPEIKWRGTGTQRVEEAVLRVAPRARIERMDTDTMGKKNRFREVLAKFREVYGTDRFHSEDKEEASHADGIFMEQIGALVPVHPVPQVLSLNRRTTDSANLVYSDNRLGRGINLIRAKLKGAVRRLKCKR